MLVGQIEFSNPPLNQLQWKELASSHNPELLSSQEPAFIADGMKLAGKFRPSRDSLWIWIPLKSHWLLSGEREQHGRDAGTQCIQTSVRIEAEAISPMSCSKKLRLETQLIWSKAHDSGNVRFLDRLSDLMFTVPALFSILLWHIEWIHLIC